MRRDILLNISNFSAAIIWRFYLCSATGLSLSHRFLKNEILPLYITLQHLSYKGFIMLLVHCSKNQVLENYEKLKNTK